MSQQLLNLLEHGLPFMSDKLLSDLISNMPIFLPCKQLLYIRSVLSLFASLPDLLIGVCLSILLDFLWTLFQRQLHIYLSIWSLFQHQRQCLLALQQ